MVAVLICVANYYWFFSPTVVEGVLDHKAVTGVKDGTSYTILLNADWEISVKDEDYEKFFSENDRNAFINKSIEDEMKVEYSEINYLVSIRVSSRDPVNKIEEGETLAYFATRDNFNDLWIGDKVRYKVARFKTATIKGLVEVTR